MNELNIIQKIAVWALPVLFAITVHEVAHGWVAKKLGDPTAMMLGRLTLNPVKHIDPLGTIILPLLMLWMGGFVFGWAKPVPITWENLKHPKRDIALVAVAGPVANLLMAILWAMVTKVGVMLGAANEASMPLVLMGGAGIFINLILMALNLLPIPPLDGGRILTGILPGPWSYKLGRVEPFGLIIIVALLATGLLGEVLGPIVHTLQTALYSIFGL